MRAVRLIMMVIVAALSVFSYCTDRSVNPITGEEQHVGLTPEQEVAMGVQVAPEMARRFGGVDRDERSRQTVKAVGEKIVAQSIAAQSGYPFDFHVLADDQTVNAFALPGGQIFITVALLERLETDERLAAVLSHEVGHVIARHSAERLAEEKLTQGLTGAVVMGSGSYEMAQVAQLVGGLIHMKYGRADEIEADKVGLCLMSQAGYRPAALVDVMRILAEAGGGSPLPEFASTHPHPKNRAKKIQAFIEDLNGTCAFGLAPPAP
jgi:predicted Zn-dependent protease